MIVNIYIFILFFAPYFLFIPLASNASILLFYNNFLNYPMDHSNIQPQNTQDPLNNSLASFAAQFQEVTLQDLSESFSLNNSICNSLSFSQTSYLNQSSVIQTQHWEQEQQIGNFTHLLLLSSTSEQCYKVMVQLVNYIAQIGSSNYTNLNKLGNNNSIFGRQDVLIKIKQFLASEVQKFNSQPEQCQSSRIYIASLLSSVSIKCRLQNRAYFCDEMFLNHILDLVEKLPKKNFECDIFIDLVALALSHDFNTRNKLCELRSSSLIRLFFSNQNNFKSFKNLTIPSLAMLTCSNPTPIPTIFAKTSFYNLLIFSLGEYIKNPSKLEKQLGPQFLKAISAFACHDLPTLFSAFEDMIKFSHNNSQMLPKVCLAICEILADPVIETSVSYYFYSRSGLFDYNQCTRNTLDYLKNKLSQMDKITFVEKRSLQFYSLTVERYLMRSVLENKQNYVRLPIFAK